MPKYRVETDQGNFLVDLDRAPDSPEQLRSLVETELAKMGGGPSPQVAPPPRQTRLTQGRTEVPRYGAMGGAATGAIMSLPFAPAAGPMAPLVPIAGAILGGTGGEGIQQVGEHLSDYLFGTFTAPRSSAEAARGIRQEVVPSALGELGGTILGRVIPRVFAPRVGKVTEAGRELSALGKEAGFTPSPTDVAPGRLLGRMEALTEKQVGGGRITEAAEREIEAMRGIPSTGKEGFLQQKARAVAGPQIDATRVARGETIQQGLEDIARAHRVGEAVEWEFPRMKETGVPDFRIDELREYMRSRVAEMGDLQQVITPQTATRLSSAGGKMTPEGAFVTEKMTRSGMTATSIVKGIAQGEGPITLRQAMSLRKDLGEMYKAGDKEPLAAFRRDMEADSALNPARAEAWEKARAYTRENIVPFRSDQPLGRLIDKQEPIAVVQELMAPRDARINLLRALEKQTGKAGPVWEAVQTEAITQLLENKQMIRQLGPETQKLLFTPEQRVFLQQYKNWVQQSKAPFKEAKGLYARTGTNIVAFDQLRQGATLLIGGAAAVGGTYTEHPTAGLVTGATILLAPNLLARMLTNPTTARWLAEGLRTPAGTQEASRLASQILQRYFSSLSPNDRALTSVGGGSQGNLGRTETGSRVPFPESPLVSP